MMPIRAENKARYPADWPAISQRVREEANQHCEWCGAGNGVRIRRGKSSDGTPVYRINSWPDNLNGLSAVDGRMLANTDCGQVSYGRPVTVVLTVAHLDHRPENCTRDNLRALCQRCHNVYDAPIRWAGRKARLKGAADG